MAILWYEGFEHYGPTGNEARMLQGETMWSSADGLISTTHVRTGDYAYRMTTLSELRRSLAGDFTIVGMGCGLYMDALPTAVGVWAIHQYRNAIANLPHISIMITPTGRIQVRANSYDGAVLGTSTLEMAPGMWNHVESKVVLSDTVGSVEVKVNGRTFISLTNIDTIRATGEATIGQVFIGQTSGSGSPTFDGLWYVDDVFVYEGDSAVGVSDFLGMYSVYFLQPTADETPQDWALTSGTSAFALVNEIPSDDDVDYIYSNTVNDETTFSVEALPANTLLVAAVMPIARARKTDSGDCDVALGVVSNAVADYATDRPLTTGYGHYFNVFELNPDTLAAFTPGDMPFIQAKRTL